MYKNKIMRTSLLCNNEHRFFFVQKALSDKWSKNHIALRQYPYIAEIEKQSAGSATIRSSGVLGVW